MGWLERLELENFKSYGGRVSVGPFKPFTSVIGPNGSGKSNLMDAISFVLGVRTAHLRGNQLKDLVYYPTAAADSTDSAEPPADRPSKAFVSLIYNRGTVDQPGETIEYMRRITPAGGSEYRLDGRVVQLERYNEALAEIGIFVKAKNFLVFQNEVEGIASNSSKELTTLFETISGSIEKKSEYDDAKKLTLQHEEAVLSLSRKRKGMAAEKKAYKEQQNEAHKYAAAQEKREQLRLDRALFRLFHLQKSSASVQLKQEQEESVVENIEGELQELESLLVNERKHVAEASKERTLLDRKLNKLAAVTGEQQTQLICVKAEQLRWQRKIQKDTKSLKQAQHDAQTKVQELDQLRGASREITLSLEALEEEVQNAESDMVSEETVKEYRSLKEEAATKTSRISQQVKAAQRAHNVADQLQQSLLSAKTDLEQRLVSTEKEAERVSLRRDAVKSELAENQAVLTQTRSEHSSFAQEAEVKANQRDNWERVVSDTSEALREAKADANEGSREKKMSESIEAMKGMFPGVHGRLTDLCKPAQTKYREAVAVIFGKMIDAVVVDNEKTGRACLNYLKDQRIGVATFLPLDGVRPPPVDERLRRLGGTTHLALDVLSFDDNVRPAVQYATGNAMVCDTLDEARRIRYDRNESVKICTVDGSLIDRAGFMSGGQGRSDGQRSRKWDRGDIEKIKRERLEAIEKLRVLGPVGRDHEHMSQVEQKLRSTEKKVLFLTEDLHTAQSKVDRLTKVVESVGEEISNKIPDITAATAEAETMHSKLKALHSDLSNLESTVFGVFASTHNVRSVAEFEERYIRRASKFIERRQKMESQRVKLESEIKFCEENDFARQGISELEGRIQNSNGKLSEIETKLAGISARKQELDAKAESLNDKMESLTQGHEQKNEKYKELKKKNRATLESLADHKKTLMSLSSRKEEIQINVGELLSSCEVDQIKLPKTSSKRKRKRRRGQDMENGDSSGSERSSAEEQKVEEGIDFSSLSKNARQASSREKQTAIEKAFDEEEKKCTEELANLAPNLRAADHMQEVVTQLTEVNSEFEAARQRAGEATERFDNVCQERNELFMQCFEHVAAKISEVYQQLTKSSAYPMGGTAYLSLESQDEPFLSGIKFNAMPPTKRFRDMDQLSGGERTVAALALIFAIHDYRPSPFFVLDEVDAALDNLNVGKVSSYVRSRTPELQTIVISLKDSFYEKADALVGIHRDIEADASRVLTLDMTQFDDDPNTTQGPLALTQ